MTVDRGNQTQTLRENRTLSTPTFIYDITSGIEKHIGPALYRLRDVPVLIAGRELFLAGGQTLTLRGNRFLSIPAVIYDIGCWMKTLSKGSSGIPSLVHFDISRHSFRSRSKE